MHVEKGLWFASFWCHLAPLRWTSVRLSSPLTTAQGSWLTIGGAAKWPSQLPGRMSTWSVLPCSLLKAGLEWFCGNHEPIDRKDWLGAALFPGPLPVLGFQVVESKAGDSSVWPHEEASSCPVPAQPSSCCGHHQAHTCPGSLSTWMVWSPGLGLGHGRESPWSSGPAWPPPLEVFSQHNEDWDHENILCCEIPSPSFSGGKHQKRPQMALFHHQEEKNPTPGKSCNKGQHKHKYENDPFAFL